MFPSQEARKRTANETPLKLEYKKKAVQKSTKSKTNIQLTKSIKFLI